MVVTHSAVLIARMEHLRIMCKLENQAASLLCTVWHGAVNGAKRRGFLFWWDVGGSTFYLGDSGKSKSREKQEPKEEPKDEFLAEEVEPLELDDMGKYLKRPL